MSRVVELLFFLKVCFKVKIPLTEFFLFLNEPWSWLTEAKVDSLRSFSVAVTTSPDFQFGS